MIHCASIVADNTFINLALRCLHLLAHLHLHGLWEHLGH
jgi:hypothetical protein